MWKRRTRGNVRNGASVGKARPWKEKKIESNTVGNAGIEGQAERERERGGRETRSWWDL